MSQQILGTPTPTDRNLFAGATVLSQTPDASNPRLCYVMVLLGNGTKNLSGAGGDFSVTITIAGNTWNGGAQTRTLGAAVRSLFQTEAFLVPANAAVTVSITSPNSADTDVNCTAYLVSESDPTSAAIADAVWDEAMSGHVSSGSFGAGVITTGTSFTYTNTATGSGFDRVTVTRS